jgi:SAM-dependent methyltransferase
VRSLRSPSQNPARSAALERGWLEENQSLHVPRLRFPLASDLPEVIHDFNRATRDKVLSHMLEGPANPVANRSCFEPEPESVVAEVDRHGLPLRTVLGLRSGLMRSDPYYTDEYLTEFYRDYYRHLYRPRRFSHSWFLSEQIRNGQRILERVSGRLPLEGRVLDIGCGMGGMLLPFLFAGCRVFGCDYGEEYAGRGKSLGLDIRVGGSERFADEGPFDLIILSHVVEHVSDPVKFLSQAVSLLKPTGLCYVQVPGLLDLDHCYGGDLLQYLQNAHRWHFTAGTLAAVLRRAGLEPVESDQRITCLAKPGSIDSGAAALDGANVLAELTRLEEARLSLPIQAAA